MVKPFLVGEEWRSAGRKVMSSVNPADGSVSAEIAIAGPQDVRDAVAAARKAVADPQWRDMPAHRRAGLLRRLAGLITARAEELARIQTSDNGKTLRESAAQVAGASDFFQYFASVCETAEAEVIPPRGPFFAFTRYEPVGVVAAITPWNSPLTLEAQKLAPALAAGNAVVLKSSEVTPQIGLEYAKMALEAGFPPGILNVVTGFGDVGAALVEEPGVDMITFTGGTATGYRIAEAAGRRGVPVLLELGGKSPNVVFEDADIGRAVRGALIGIFHNSGQSCNAGSRILVQRSIYDSFMERLIDSTRKLRVGHPHDAGTDVAPLSSFGHRERVEALISGAVESGATLLCGGTRPQGSRFEQGAYLEPALLAAPNDHPIAQEEIFGPVGVAIPFEDEEDLVRMANDSRFGLACALWTSDFPRAMRVGERINTGTVWVNTYKVNAVNVPFGGNKASGYGRECGIQGMRAYSTVKSFYIDRSEQPIPWPPSVLEKET